MHHKVCPFEYNQENSEKGKQLYEMFCAHCHGINGDGKGSITHPVYSAIPSYSDDLMIRRTGGNMKDLSAGNINAGGNAATASPTRAVFSGGQAPSNTNAMEYIAIATGGASSDFAGGIRDRFYYLAKLPELHRFTRSVPIL